VLGVYEPMIVLADADARETSLLIERDTTAIDALSACYHRACYYEADSQGQAGD
jgi:hypothetical protein